MLEALSSLFRFLSSVSLFVPPVPSESGGFGLSELELQGAGRQLMRLLGTQLQSSGLAAFSIHSSPLSHVSSLLGSFDTGATVVGAVSVFIQLFLWDRYGGKTIELCTDVADGREVGLLFSVVFGGKGCSYTVVTIGSRPWASLLFQPQTGRLLQLPCILGQVYVQRLPHIEEGLTTLEVACSFGLRHGELGVSFLLVLKSSHKGVCDHPGVFPSSMEGQFTKHTGTWKEGSRQGSSHSAVCSCGFSITPALSAAVASPILSVLAQLVPAAMRQRQS